VGACRRALSAAVIAACSAACNSRPSCQRGQLSSHLCFADQTPATPECFQRVPSSCCQECQRVPSSCCQECQRKQRSSNCPPSHLLNSHEFRSCEGGQWYTYIYISMYVCIYIYIHLYVRASSEVVRVGSGTRQGWHASPVRVLSACVTLLLCFITLKPGVE